MDPPLSDDDDDDSLYSSSVATPVTHQTGLEFENNTLSQSSSSPERRALSEFKSSDAADNSTELQTSSRSVSIDKDINDEDIKVKIPLSTSIMLTKLDHNTNNIIKNLSEPKIEKLNIRFQPIGSIEQIQPKIFKISSSQQFQTLVKFLNKKLAKKIKDKKDNKLFGGYIFCYLNNSFTPGPEETIGNLFEHFAVNNELVVSYCDTMAFR